MYATLRILLALLGIASTLIPTAILLFGPQPVGTFFATMADLGAAAPALGGADTGSELRFYAVFFAAYGLVTLHTARTLGRNLPRVPWIAALFLAGGLGRVLSLVADGAPHPLFWLLGTVELVLPAVLFGLWRGVLTSPSSHHPH